MAIIFITHDLGVVAQIADHVVVMYLGRVMENGPVDDIFHAPAAPLYAGAAALDPEHARPEARRAADHHGRMPHPLNRPPGCPFHPRCADVMPGRCDQRVPALCRSTTSQRRAASSTTTVEAEPCDRRRAGDQPPLLEVRDLKKYFPIRQGLLRRSSATCARWTT